MNDVIRDLAPAGARDVVVAPIGFVCDHVEVLYDLDVEARADRGRARAWLSPRAAANDHPAFIACWPTSFRTRSDGGR